MRLVPSALVLALALSVEVSAEEVLVLADGNRMTVASYEVRGTVVVIRTVEGKLRSFPVSYVDLDAMRDGAETTGALPAAPSAAGPDAAASPSIPGGREARLRWALEHFGLRGFLELFHKGLESGIDQGENPLSPELEGALLRAFQEPFRSGPFFDRMESEFLARAEPRSVDVWLTWLDSPSARKVIGHEDWSGMMNATASKGSVSRVRESQVQRLLEAGYPLGGFFPAFAEGLTEMVRGMTTGAPEEVETLFSSADWSQLESAGVSMQAEIDGVLSEVYQSLSDAELEPYVRFWESPDGRNVGHALRESLSVAYREAGGAAGSGVARLFEGVFFPDEAPTAQTLSFADRNFEFAAPAANWVALDVSRFNTRAALGYIRRDPQVTFMIVSEHDENLLSISSEAATEIARANLEAGTKEYRLLSEEPFSVGDMNGVLMSSECLLADRPAYYLHWVYSVEGSIYQLVAWGAKSEVDLPRLMAEAESLYRGFRLLEPPGPATVASRDLLTDVRSDRYGYTMRLSSASWMPWNDLETSAPEADLGGVREHSAFLVVPVQLGDLDPSIDVLTAALLKRVDIDASSLDARATRDLGDAARRGRSVDYRRNIDETDYTYRLHVWKGRHIGYLVAAWTSEGDAASLDPVLSLFDFDPEFRPQASGRTEREKSWQGQILYDIGREYFERDQFGLSEAYFRNASESRPTDSEAFLYLLTALSFTSRFEEALALLDGRGAAFADNVDVQSYRPFLASKLGRAEEAATLYRELFARGYQNDSDLWDYANLLLDLERADEALAEVARYRKDRDSVSVARLEAQLHHRAERYDRAIEILEKERVAYPAEDSLALDLLDAYYDAGRYQDVVDEAVRFAAKSGAPATILLRSGQARIALGQLDEAKTAFVAALDADPKNSDARDYLDYVSGLLGQGDHELAREPVEAVALPASLGAPPAPTPAFTEESLDYGAFYLERSTAIAFRSGEDYRRTDRYVVRLTDQKAITTFSSFAFEVDPRTERLFVNELRVTDAQGRTVAEGDLSSYYLTDDASDGMATSDKLLNVPVPGLSVGNTLSLTVTLERLSPPKQMPFIRHTFSSGFPVLRSSLYVKGDLDAVRFESAGAEADTGAEGGALWTVATPPLNRTEDYSESVERFLPFVWLGSSGESWEAVGRDYLADIEERLGVDDESRALARELVAEATTREAKIEALADYVQTSLTYQAIEFGRRAWLPSQASEIVGNRYGDCKDHASLFYVLLKALGEPAELVLVSTDTEIQPDVPSMDQFNHMIVYVPGYAGGHFFDLTDKNHDVAALPPLGLGGRSALLLDPESPRLVQIPEYPDDSSRARAVRKLAVDGEDLLVREEISFEGYYGAWMRSGFKSIDAATRRERVLRYLDAGRRVTIEELEIDNLAEPKKALVFRLRYRLHGVLHEADDKLIGRIPAAWEKTLLEVPAEPDRRTPYRVSYPLSVESEVRVALPEGYVLASEPESLEATRPDLVRWRVSTDLSQHELIVHLESLRPRVRGTASEYQELVTTLSSFLDAAEPSLVLARR